MPVPSAQRRPRLSALALCVAFMVFASPPGAESAIIISELDILNNKVEIINDGATAVDLSSWFFCNRTLPSGRYRQFTTFTIDAANSTGDDNFVLDPSEILTVDLSVAFVPDVSGELGLYVNNTGYANSANIRDYVAYGADGQRDNVANGAGIWTTGTFVEVAGIAAGETLQLLPGADGNSTASYVLGASTIGNATNVPEPGAVFLLLASAAGCAVRRRR